MPVNDGSIESAVKRNHMQRTKARQQNDRKIDNAKMKYGVALPGPG
jgi:hypothetical protein